MNEVEDLIVDALRLEADAAPPAGALLGSVHTRVRRRARRRLAAVGTLAAATLVAGAAITVQLNEDRDTLRPRPLRLAAPDDSPLVAGSLPAVEFPVSPGWLPEGVSRTPRLARGDSGLSASYDDATRAQYVGIDIWSGDRDMTFTGDGTTRRATTHLGRPATLAFNGESYSLGWRRDDGTWLTVIGGNDWGAEAVVRRVAEGLTDDPVSARLPFELALVPRGSELVDWSTRGSVVFVPSGDAERWRTTHASVDVVMVAARRATADLTGRGEAVTVRGRPGWLLTEPGGRHSLVIQLPDAVCLVLSTPAWDRADVLRLAESMEYTGGLPPQEG